MDASTTYPVVLTGNAIKEVKRIMSDNKIAGGGLRIKGRC